MSNLIIGIEARNIFEKFMGIWGERVTILWASSTVIVPGLLDYSS